MKEPLAYQAMFRFLEERYFRLPSDALGGLLGEMQLTEDGQPYDPAIVEEWDRAVQSVEQTSGFAVPVQRQRRAG